MVEETLTVNLLQEQYKWVRSSRAVLFTYCRQINATDFLRENSTFGRGSIRNLLTHIANVYEFWLLNTILKKNITIRSFDTVVTIEDAVLYFEEIDRQVAFFFDTLKNELQQSFTVQLGERMLIVSPLQAFSHVITHEYHHKGQILSLSRHLGYSPPDTDMIR